MGRSGSLLRPLLAAATSFVIANAASAAPAPDSATLVRLQAAADSSWRVRLTTNRATYLLVAPRIEASGVVVERRDSPPALVTIGSPSQPEKRIPWAEIERIDSERSAAGRGALRGALTGAAIGGVLMLAMDPTFGSEEADGLWPFFALGVSTASGGLIGALMGLGSGSPTLIYP